MCIPLRMIICTTLLALALIGSSWYFKGNPIGDWIDAAFYIAIASFLASQIVMATRSKPCCPQARAPD